MATMFKGIWFFANIIFIINQVGCDIVSGERVCTSETCQKTASLLRKHMDKSVDPCDDFYQFACGKYLVNSTHYKYWPVVDPTLQLDEKVEYQMKHGIEKITENDPEYMQKLSSFYWSCMDDGVKNTNGRAEVMELMEKLGGWPVLNKLWNESRFDWKETMYEFRNAGLSFSSFFYVSYGTDLKDGNTTINIDEPELTLSVARIFSGMGSEYLKRYFDYMVDLAELLGADRSYATKELNNSLNFEIELARLRSHATNISSSYNPMTVNDLSSLCPQVPWLEYLTKILRPPTSLQPTDTVIVRFPSSLGRHCELFEKTPGKTLSNYAFFGAISYFVNLLGPEARKLREKFQTEVYHRPNLHPHSKWKRCISVVKHRMPKAVGAFFVRTYFDRNTKPEASKVAEIIQEQMRKSIRAASWMSNDSRKSAEEKIDSMISLIAYPDDLLNETSMNEIYKNLSINRHSYFESTLNLNLLDSELAALEFGKLIEKSKWPSTIDGNPATAIAGYSILDNSFILQAGLLQRPYFHAANPKYINFGGIGSVIGHEMSHGFDEHGRQFDKDGRHFDWWDSESDAIFLEKTQCFVNQTNALAHAKNLKINAKETLVENIADNVGVKQAYLAYDAWASNRTTEPRLDGLMEYTPRQLFWLAFANSMCEKVRPGARRRKRQISHSYPPNHLRVISALNNVPQFSRDFNCPVGRFMNHPDKCDMW